MKLRYKILYMSFGAGLVVLGMMLNSLVSGDAEAQVGVKDNETIKIETTDGDVSVVEMTEVDKIKKSRKSRS